MKKILGLLTVLLSAGMLMGCIGVKELTEEEEARISEYAATLLLKHNANYKNLLWEEEEKKEEEEAEEPPVEEEEEKPEEIVSGPAVSGDNPTVGPVIENKPLAEAFGLAGIDIQYSGCEFTKSFPEEGKHYMTQAKEGKKLLIVKFQIKNNTSAAVPVDILSGVPSFRIRFNEEEVIAKMTIILEDLSTMIEDVPAGATVEKVLVGEVPEEFSEQINSLSITTRFQGTTSETTLLP